jgi:beta-glucosidase
VKKAILSSPTEFPPGFLWGAATSAYQIEGSPLADGAGASHWHRFAHEPGKVSDGSNGDVACDHYRRFADDVRLMRELGIGSYRFSTSWSRVLPEGVGRANQAGLDFYSRLVDTLLEHDIQPMATLYHWDLPAALEDGGGWGDPRSVDWFVEYAQLMYRTLGDRVPQWATINEPWVIVDAGYVEGVHAPGRRDWGEAVKVAKHLLLAHGAAVEAYRAVGKHEIGLVVNLVPIYAASDSPDDRGAAQRLDAYFNRQFLDPALLGKLDPDVVVMFETVWSRWSEDELRQICQPIDFLGINYYLRMVVREDVLSGPARARMATHHDTPVTQMGWEIYPQGLTEILRWVKARYGDLPLYITENGAAFNDNPLPDGTVNDTQRVEYLADHLRAARRAIAEGVDLRGYFVWSLLDNFEWACGYSRRFGIVRVDFDTQQRLPKASARFYSDVIRSNGAVLEDRTNG